MIAVLRRIELCSMEMTRLLGKNVAECAREKKSAQNGLTLDWGIRVICIPNAITRAVA